MTKYNIDIIKKVLTCIENESKYDELTEISKIFYSDTLNYINDWFDDSSDNVIINKLKIKEKKLLKQLLIKLFIKEYQKYSIMNYLTSKILLKKKFML